MPPATPSADARRALLEQYLRNAAQRPAAAVAAIPPHPADRRIPLSFGQQQLWFLSQLLGNTPAYNECVTIHLPGSVDIATLERSFVELLRRHEPWRTTFALVDGQPVQRVEACPESISFPFLDLAGLAAAEQEDMALAAAYRDAVAPFDLATGPLWRALLVRLADDSHRLYLTLHHIIFDGYAVFQIVLPELDAIYRALSADRPLDLPPLPIRYADYASWQHGAEQAAERARRIVHWRTHLAQAPAALELPTDRPHPAVQTFRGAVQSFTLSRQFTADLRALGQREGATLYMTLLAAFNVLLFRHTGQADLAIGTASAGRNRSELQGLLGLFLNTLVLRTQLDGERPFGEVLRAVRETTIAATANEVPFEYLVRELQPDRVPGRNPFFSALITLEPHAPALASGWALTTLDVTTDTAKFDLSLKLDDRPTGLIGRFEYSTDLFDAATIARLVGQFQTLLAGIVVEPTRPIATMPLLPDQQSRQLLYDWNDTPTAFPEHCLHDLVAAQAARTPDAVAAVHADRAYTYATLETRANRFARHLHGVGVRPGTLVALATDRSLDMIVGLLGILKAGGAYLPLDPSYPAERLAFMLADSAAPVLVTQYPLLERLPPTQARVICLDTDWPAIASESGAAFTAEAGFGATLDDLAYVIYTSGSTGQPKGVQISHRALANFLAAMAREPGLTAADTLLAVTTLSFDIAALELWLPLTVGARVVLADRAVAADGVRLAALLRDSGATVMQATPATWRLLIAAGWRGDPRLTLLCGGEALPRALADQLLDRCGALWNMYGPTETTIWSAAHRVARGAGAVPIGGPLANTTFLVLDERRQLVPIGVFGELYIGGLGLAAGYRNRPELTAERFIADPFAPDAGRLYRTGDRVRWRPDATLEFSGRLDYQVKVRGHRIELGEIEAALLGQPTVREAVVVVREDTPDDTRLVAYVTLRDGQDATSADLRASLRAGLPEYMVPATCVILDALPLTPNGKVDRRALPAPDQAQGETVRPVLGPRDATELQLTRLWEGVLNLRPIGVGDNFFDLGGHSLLAVRLFARIAAEFGRDLPLATLFQAPTIAELAAFLRQGERVVSWSSLVPLQPHGHRPPFFCIHPIGGNLLSYRDLARHLGPDQPVYGLQARGLDGRSAPHTRVEAMAAHYLAEMRQLQPRGPYYVGGQCFGGMIALEVAQQLRAQGETVGLLAMFDSYAPGYTKLLSRRANVLLGGRWLRQRADHHWTELREQGLSAAPGYLRQRARTITLRARNRVWQGAYRLYERFGQPLPERLQNVRQGCLLAQRAYVPALYHGRPILFVVREREEVIDPDPQFGWGELATDGIAVYEIPGGHKTMWQDPNAQALAATLRRCLNEAQERITGPMSSAAPTVAAEATFALLD